MSGESNTKKKKKRDISGIILPPLLPATVVSDEAWLRRAERREVISLTERLWFFTLMWGESRRGDEMKTVRMKGAAHHPRKRKSINGWQSQNAVVMLSDWSSLAGLIRDLKSLINKRGKGGTVSCSRTLWQVASTQQTVQRRNKPVISAAPAWRLLPLLSWSVVNSIKQ